MNRSTLSALTVACLAGLAVAQPTYVSGLLHEPVGSATISPPVGRGVTVNNLGSASNAVNVQCSTLFGAQVGIDATPLHGTSPQSREIRIRPKGWDGTIKGTLRLMSTIDGVITGQMNFSPINAAGVRWRALDADGNVIREGEVAGALVLFGIGGPQCPDDASDWTFSTQGEHLKEVKIELRRSGQSCGRRITGLPGGPIENVSVFGFEPIPCAGCTSFTDLGSIEIGTVNIPQLHLSDAAVNSFSWGMNQAGAFDYSSGGGRIIQCSGSGNGRITEECDGPAPCDINHRRLPVHNLGSSGQDGVEIRWPRAAGSGGGGGGGGGGSAGFEMSASRGRGHVTLLKAYDDESGQMLSRCTETSSPIGLQLEVDNSAMGAPAMIATFYDDAGNPLDSISFAGAVAVLDVSMLCPPGSYWTKKFIFGHWHWYCQHWMAITLPGGGVINAASVSLGSDTSSLCGRLTLHSDDPDSIIIDDFAVIEPTGPACDPDVNCDGVPDQSDVACIILAVAGDMGCFCQSDPDFNKDGVPDQGDVADVILSVAGAPCP